MMTRQRLLIALDFKRLNKCKEYRQTRKGEKSGEISFGFQRQMPHYRLPRYGCTYPVAMQIRASVSALPCAQSATIIGDPDIVFEECEH